MSSANIPETAIADEAVPADATNKRLSTISKMYDVNGDGDLDEAELAMRNMDASGRGYLTNDKVYALMQEQLAMQKRMFNMKKVIYGLGALVVVLALSNLGTSFASAILAKDTTTNTNSELVDSSTGEVLATDTAVVNFDVEEVSGSSSRALELCETTGNGNSAETLCGVDSSSFTMMSVANALEMLKQCKKTRTVKLTYMFDHGEEQRIVCGPAVTCTAPHTGSTFSPNGNSPTQGDLCVGDTMLYVREGRGANGPIYTISSVNDGGDAARTADVLTSDEGELCYYDDDCDSGLTCKIGSPVVDALPALATACNATTPCAGDGPSFCHSNGFCGNCDTNSTCAGDIYPTCVAFRDSASYCGCTDDDECPRDHTCGQPSCVAGMTDYCSADHDLEWGCGTCVV